MDLYVALTLLSLLGVGAMVVLIVRLFWENLE